MNAYLKNYAIFIAFLAVTKAVVAPIAKQLNVPVISMNRPGFELTPEVRRTSRGLMKKYKTEFKLDVVQSFLAGEGGAKLLARQWLVPEEKICT